MLKRFLFIVALLLTTYASSKTPQRQIQGLVDAEKEFAQLSVQEGIRASFLKFFADDGIAFSPSPVNAKEFYGAGPAGVGKVILDWTPTFSDISNAGDMGYNTGPYTIAERNTGNLLGQGLFFSVWKRQSDDTWKVALDIGVRRNEPSPEKAAWREAEPGRFKNKSKKTNATSADLKRAEIQFATESKQHGLASAYTRFADDNARLHTSENIAVGKVAILQQMKSSNRQAISIEPLFSAVASSDDLGYSYGKYTLTATGEKGFFAHVWKRNRTGDWKLVADVMNAQK